MARYRKRRYFKRSRRFKRRSGSKGRIGKVWKVGRGTPSAFNMEDSYSKGCLWG